MPRRAQVPFLSKSKDLDFFICVRKAQQHLAEGQHHFEQGENIIVRLRTQMNKPRTVISRGAVD